MQGAVRKGHSAAQVLMAGLGALPPPRLLVLVAEALLAVSLQAMRIAQLPVGASKASLHSWKLTDSQSL